MHSIIEQALDVIERRPGIGSNALAAALGIPPCNARRAAKAGVAAGLVTITGNQVAGFQYWPVGGASLQRQRVSIPHDNGVIEGEVIPPPHSDSRSLVVYGAGQPADNRLVGTLARTNGAQHGQDLVAVPGRSFMPFDAAFAADPSGDETLAALVSALNAYRRDPISP